MVGNIERRFCEFDRLFVILLENQNVSNRLQKPLIF